MDSSTVTLWTRSFQYKDCPVSFYFYHSLKEIAVLNANSLDPDQTPRSVASDLVLYWLPMSILCDAWHKWVNVM